VIQIGTAMQPTPQQYDLYRELRHCPPVRSRLAIASPVRHC
jgi:hypothetical protein